MRHATLFLLLAASLSCGPDAGMPQPPPAPVAEGLAADKPEPDIDADNLLNLAYGAAVVSRTGELSLEHSAVAAIDGVFSSGWSSPPYGRDQTFVFAFAAPARVTQLGITTVDKADLVPAKVAFERSMDGASWTAAGEMRPRPSKTPQLFDVKPFTAAFLRVRVDDGADLYSMIPSIHAVGSELEPPRPRAIAGCWTINGFPAAFEQQGARVAGVIRTDPPTFVEGGTDGRVVRAVWLRGPMWGHAIVTATPDSTRLTGLEIHEEINLQHLGVAWFGERCDGDAVLPAVPAPRAFLERVGRLPLYGLAFGPDDRLLTVPSAAALEALRSWLVPAPSQSIRVTAHEARGASPEENRRHTDARIASIRAALQERGVDTDRIEFVSAGSEWKGPTLSAALQRLLASRVDVERVR